MAWLAFDPAAKAVEDGFHLGPVEHWRTMRDQIHREICDKGLNQQQNELSSIMAPMRSMPHR
jgi:GH15 family glucan-1,4-alpha-glucosidase